VSSSSGKHGEVVGVAGVEVWERLAKEPGSECKNVLRLFTRIVPRRVPLATTLLGRSTRRDATLYSPIVDMWFSLLRFGEGTKTTLHALRYTRLAAAMLKDGLRPVTQESRRPWLTFQGPISERLASSTSLPTSDCP
jgi:hypothetical protein